MTGGESIRIIPATIIDAQKVAGVLTDATQRKVEYGDNAWGSGEWTAQEIEPFFEHSSIYLAYVNDEIAGTVSIVWDADPNWPASYEKAAYIHRLAARSKFKGIGLGSALISFAIKTAADKNYQYLRLDCDAGNTALCNYYERTGFKKVGAQPTSNPNYSAALYQHNIDKPLSPLR